jgi:phenylpyruvate tautomerase PptA (4-oxalocrotonate tautomerase family)
MPYLQLDVPNHYPVEVKRGLAHRLGEKYARIMQTTPELVTVAFRELGEGGLWCCSAGEPENRQPCSHATYGGAARPNNGPNWPRR